MNQNALLNYKLAVILRIAMQSTGTIAVQTLLREKLEELRRKNASYSMRAFSKKLGITSGTLSLILLGKRSVSRTFADRMCKKLLVDPVKREKVLAGFSRNKATNGAGTTLHYLQLAADRFEAVSEWYYFAILNLCEVRGFREDPEWIARRLGLSSEKTRAAIERLFRLGMLVEREGKWIRAVSHYSTTDDVQNAALKRSHYQNLQLAEQSLDRDPLEVRDFTWLTLTVDRARLPKAKALIRRFQDEFSAEISGSDTEQTEVYRMAIQFFPLTTSNFQGEKS